MAVTETATYAVKFIPPLTPATLIRRYKRFLADMRLADGTAITAHCPNTGAMTGCATPGAACWLSRSDNPRRKYAWTWELVTGDGEAEPLVGINTGRANRLVQAGLEADLVPTLQGARILRREPPNPEGPGRFDLLLETADGEPCWVEIKNVTAAVENGRAVFPDAVTVRGARHMRELAALASTGRQAVLCFCVQRSDVTMVAPADDIDPEYGVALRAAAQAGVYVCALGCDVAPSGLEIARTLPVILD